MLVRPLPPQPALRARFSYDPETGECVWYPVPVPASSTAVERQRLDMWNKRWAGGTVGCGKPKKVVSFGNKRFLLHRLIWKWMTGEEPNEIDHLNGDSADNRWSNLRNVDRGTNNRNCALRSDNRSGCVGVYYVPERKAWRVWVEAAYVGQFRDFEAAVEARQRAQATRGFTERHGRAG